MKKIRVIQIIELIILIIIAVALISFLSRVSKESVEGKQSESFKNYFNFNFASIGERNLIVLKEEEVSTEAIEKIEMDTGSANISIFVTDNAIIKIVESANRELTKEELFTLSTQNGVLTIKRGKSIPRVVWGWQQHKIELFIPQSYIGDLDLNSSSGDTKLLSELKLGNLSIQHTSGNIQSDYLIEVQSFSSHLSSGNIQLEYLKCSEYEISIASGNTTISKLEGSGSIKASSGNIKVKELVGGVYSIKAASGNIELRNVEGTGEVSTTSGEIDIDYNEIIEYAKLKASSGNIHIGLSEYISFEMNAKCTSGGIDGNININYTNKEGNEAVAVIGDGPYVKLILNASSGNITVDQN